MAKKNQLFDTHKTKIMAKKIKISVKKFKIVPNKFKIVLKTFKKISNRSEFVCDVIVISPAIAQAIPHVITQDGKT